MPTRRKSVAFIETPAGLVANDPAHASSSPPSANHSGTPYEVTAGNLSWTHVPRVSGKVTTTWHRFSPDVSRSAPSLNVDGRRSSVTSLRRASTHGGSGPRAAGLAVPTTGSLDRRAVQNRGPSQLALPVAEGGASRRHSFVSTTAETYSGLDLGLPGEGDRDSRAVEIYYEIHGPPDAPIKALLISGHASSCRAWVTSLNYFKADGRFQVCVFDNRGVGDSTQTTKDFGLEDMAKDTIDLLRHIGWTSQVFVVGVSMGGMIAQQLALLAPEMISSLALVSTSPSRPVPPLKVILYYLGIAVGWTPIKKAEEVFRMFTYLNFPDNWLRVKTEEPYTNYPTNGDAIYAMLEERKLGKPRQSAFARSAQTDAVAGNKIRPEDLEKIGQQSFPIMVITGDEDIQIDMTYSKRLADIVKAPLHIMPGGGHDLADMFPNEFHSLLIRFASRSDQFLPRATLVNARRTRASEGNES
ncbi:Alpha/Beta hydrolase protein [Zopfochytrium polystomum]|nr:Alpha/Beta hydrolase protein [Zopfochytrium polystomum]